MKKLFALLVLILVSVLAFVISNPPEQKTDQHSFSPQTNASGDIFLIGSHQSGLEWRLDRLKDTLGFNFWMRYLGHAIKDTFNTKYIYPNGWTSDDTLFSNSVPLVQNILTNNKTHNLKTIMHRPKIEWLAFGQRSDYQCEDSCFLSQEYQDYWFYTYRNTNTIGYNYEDNSQFGNGIHVKYCTRSNYTPTACENSSDKSQSGYVVKGLKANREQINVKHNVYGPPYPGLGDAQFDWYILPRIRIKPQDANNTIKVCRIEVINFLGDTIKKVDIKGDYFLDNNYYYDGSYLDELYQGITDSLKVPGNHFKTTDNDSSAFNKTGVAGDDVNGLVDFRVYWYGQCDMWIDRIRVEDERAYNLFTPSAPHYNDYQQMLEFEKNLADTQTTSAYRFYTEELQFNHLPCLKYVYDKLRQNGMEYMYYGGLGDGWYSDHLPYNAHGDLGINHFMNHFIDSIKPKELFYGAYPLTAREPTMNTNISKIPNTLLNHSGDSLFAEVVSPTQYDDWLQNYLEIQNISYGNYSGTFIANLKQIKSIADARDIKIISPIQTHSLWGGGDGELREPTNQEIEMMVNTSLCYGSKGIIYNQYISWGEISKLTAFSRGLVEPDLQNTGNYIPRTRNVYWQNKWQGIIDINKKLKKWGPILMTFNNPKVKSYIYRSQEGRYNLYTQSYFTQFVTSRPGPSGLQTDCYEDFIPNYIPSGWLYDCQYGTYLQIATFENSEPNTKYFMVVNKRCSPYINDDNDNNIGGRRKVRAYFHSNYSGFPSSTTMNIFDCSIDSLPVASFWTNNPGYIDLGYYMPGEGKLYKIVPVSETGGTLAGDEYINSTETIKKNIYNGGHNITFGTSANVSFSDSAGIYMTGGTLKIGNPLQTYGSNLHIQGASDVKWQGLNLDGCDTVEIYGATFANILPNQPAINLTNCYHFKIEGNLFNCRNDENFGGIYADYSQSLQGGGDSIYQYIGNNTFSFSGSSNNAIQIVSSASSEIPLIIENNIFNTGESNISSSGIFLSNITGGAIKHNQITNYLNSILLVSSTCDFYQNTITTDNENSNGIQLKIGEGNMTQSNGYFIGGYNVLTARGPNSKNIDVGDSYFNVDQGYNVFDIDFGNSQSHFSGYFPSTARLNQKAELNCFKNNSNVDTASINITQGYEGDLMIFDADPYYCSDNDMQDFAIFTLTGGINDTVYYTSGGNGGGYKEGQAMAIQTVSSYKLLKDSININIRKRNYNITEIQCKELLLQYPDSTESIPAISKLYISSLSLDNQGNHMQGTKTFFENLILNNSNNAPLIKRANYFVQKCKVAVGQYASALQGFQEIINQNPYSYEGLIASWDYGATTLLMGSGGENNDELKENNIGESNLTINDLHAMLDTLKTKKSVVNSYSTENYDSKKFTKKDRETIKGNVENAFTNERTKQIKKLNELENKITTLSNSTSKNKTEKKKNDISLVEAKKELKVLKSLGEVVKVKKPKTVIEHKKIVSADIKKVFGVEKLTGNSKNNNILPTEFSLSQNYPNPFNPVTKINYELPKDARVKLVIYDILGREIKSLVNNEFKQAGRYTVEFNGTQYASGVYFYRIQVEGGKTYTSVKKMVLIK